MHYINPLSLSARADIIQTHRAAFIIHTSTTWLCQMLHNTPQILWHGLSIINKYTGSTNTMHNHTITMALLSAVGNVSTTGLLAADLVLDSRLLRLCINCSSSTWTINNTAITLLVVGGGEYGDVRVCQKCSETVNTKLCKKSAKQQSAEQQSQKQSRLT